jgi:hypothetical protein
MIDGKMMDLLERIRYQADSDHPQGDECCLLHMAADEIISLEIALQLAIELITKKSEDE